MTARLSGVKNSLLTKIICFKNASCNTLTITHILVFVNLSLKGGEALVKIYNKDGKEQEFSIVTVENELKASGLPELLAKEVAQRLEERVQDGWTAEQLSTEECVELRRLQEAIDRTYVNLKSCGSMGKYNVGEQRTAKIDDDYLNEQPIAEDMVECKNINA